MVAPAFFNTIVFFWRATDGRPYFFATDGLPCFFIRYTIRLRTNVADFHKHTLHVHRNLHDFLLHDREMIFAISWFPHILMHNPSFDLLPLI